VTSLVVKKNMATYNRFTIAKPEVKKAVTTANRFTMSPVATPTEAAPTPVAPTPVSSTPLVYKPEQTKAPYSFMESIKPLDIKLPESVSTFLKPVTEEYKQREGVIQAASEKQRTALKPLEDLIRKPLESTWNAVNYTKDVPLKIMNHPAVAPVMAEVAKRTSGTGIVSAVQAIGPKTFDEAYQANRAYQAGDPSKLNQFFYQLGDSLPQTAIGVALNFVPYAGRPLSTAYWTALSAADQIENKGSVTSLGNIGIDVLGDRMLGNSIEALFKAPAKTLMQTVVKNFGVEGGTEVAQDLLKMGNDYSNAKTPEEKAKILASAKEYFTSGQILMTGLVGGISGSAVGTASYTINQSLPKTTVAEEEKRDYITELKNLQNNPDPTIADTARNLEVDLSRVNPMDQMAVAQSMVESIQPTPIRNERLFDKETPQTPSEQSDISELQRRRDALVTLRNSNPGDEKIVKGIERLNQQINDFQPTPAVETKATGPGYKKFISKFDDMVKNKTIFPEDATILKTLFENTSDDYLGSLNLAENAKFKNTYGRFSIRRNGFNQYQPSSNLLQMQKGAAGKGVDASRVFSHEFGHAGWYMILTQEERDMVTRVYHQLTKGGARQLFTAGLEGNVTHHAKSVQEFFAESFAEYIMSNKVPAAQIKPLYQRLAIRFWEGMKRLVNRQEHAALTRIRPLFERALSGDKTTPLADLMAQEPPSFKQELLQIFQQGPTKEVPPTSLFPSGAVQNKQIEPEPEAPTPMDQIEAAAAPSIQNLPPDIEVEPLQKVIEGEKRTPLNERIRWIDYLRTPWRVFERMGIKANYLELLEGYTKYTLELPKNIDKITAWSKQVGPESNERIFRFLDGETIELNPQEAKIAGEIKTWLSQWADRLGMKADERISSYITHIFPIGSKGEIPEEIAYLINKKIPGQVYDPYLLQRAGAEGYIKDTWKALDAYVKRATRKVNMDPALASLKEASAQLTDTSQLNYLNRYIGAVNLRPTELDTSIDNHIKEKFGYIFGVRPTSSLTRQARQMIARAKIGGSVTSFAKNLTQGVNTFSELGTRYTVRGYVDLVKFGSKELEENGVLIAPFLEDQTYSAIKKFAEKFDKVLFLNMNASELVNRGAAYYGAKAKYLAGNITPKEIAKALNKEVTKDYVPNMEDAVAYGKFIAAKTQFQFGSLDTPVALNSDIAKTFAQFQTFGLKQVEFIGSMVSEREYAKLFRYILSSMLLFTYIGGAFGMKWDDSFKTLRWGMPPVIQFFIDIWGKGIMGEDSYGNKLDAGQRVKAVGKSLFTNVVPAGAQISRSIEGFQAVNSGKSTTSAGNFQYKIAQTPMNYIKGTLFGKYNLPEAKAFSKAKDAPKKSGTSRKRF
jgi:hypothetical protein